MTRIYTGIDLVEISRFSRISPAIRGRFFKRVFTCRETAYINDSDQRAAGIFAAKEAAAKALGCGIGPIHWQDIEITHSESNQPLLCLHENAKKIAEAAAVCSWSVSITHTKTTAAAVVVCITE